MRRIAIEKATGFRVLATSGYAQAASMVLSAGGSTGGRENRHARADQWLYVVSGTGRAVVEGREEHLGSGTLLLIEPAETHEIINTGEEPLVTLNFYAPPEY